MTPAIWSSQNRCSLSEFPGYETLACGSLPEIEASCQRLRHVRSGAEVLAVRNQDENKVFGVSFRTLPEDSSGLPHILEHSVLCGSKLYPLKDPFIHLWKGSLNTFLNAFTFPDKTCYPAASQNQKDLFNLMRVYLDAVFFPLLGPEVLQQEGWHHELESAANELICKGVVYSEMKGAYSDPLTLVRKLSQQSLFPDTTYGHDSGGEPEVIPELSYARFKAFYEEHYHPSNALLYLYGDLELEAALEIISACLDQFSAKQIEKTVPLQAPWNSPRRSVHPFDAGDAPSLEKAAMIVMNWLLPEGNDPARRLAFSVLDYILIGTSASPLRKALIDSALGDTLIGGGLGLDLRQLSFSVGLKGMRACDADRFESLVMETLAAARDKIDPKTLEAALNTVEFSLRENNTGSFPRGLMLMLRGLGAWQHGHDPFEFMAYEETLAEIKRRGA
jgi:presequence protease